MSGERIETAGELDALPNEAVIVDATGEVRQRHGDLIDRDGPPRAAWAAFWRPSLVASPDLPLPAVVVYHPDRDLIAEAEARGAARALLEAADDAEALSAAADLAKIVAPVDGGGRRRHEVIDRAAAMHEEPWTWLRARTAQTGGTDD